jgi:hypothetical protein
MINKQIMTAIFKLHPEVVLIRGDIAYDSEENEVEYDLQAVTEQAETDEQAAIDAKQSALNKLMALGLTEEEALALGK